MRVSRGVKSTVGGYLYTSLYINIKYSNWGLVKTIYFLFLFTTIQSYYPHISLFPSMWPFESYISRIFSFFSNIITSLFSQYRMSIEEKRLFHGCGRVRKTIYFLQLFRRWHWRQSISAPIRTTSECGSVTYDRVHFIIIH